MRLWSAAISSSVPRWNRRVFFRITDNWIELAVRFIVEDHGIREVKDRISRDIMDRFDEAGIGIASSTYDVVGMPPLRVQIAQPEEDRAPVPLGTNGNKAAR